jgi:hypothetical protein
MAISSTRAMMVKVLFCLIDRFFMVTVSSDNKVFLQDAPAKSVPQFYFST